MSIEIPDKFKHKVTADVQSKLFFLVNFRSPFAVFLLADRGSMLLNLANRSLPENITFLIALRTGSQAL